MTGPDTTIHSRHELTKVALGEADADLAIINGDILNVYTGEILTGDCILIKNGKIAYTGKYAKRGIGKNTQVIDAAGKVLIPGFIDGHTHMDYLYSSQEISRYAMKTGTTTIITEAAEITFRLGYRGIREYLKSIKNQPIKFWFTLPPMGTISPISNDHALTIKEIKQLLRREDCVGLGEVYWGPVNAGNEQQLQIISETLRAGKKVEGHSAGAAANKLQAYIAVGITSDHEPITCEEAIERLRLGLSVMVREGEVRQDLEAVSKIKDYPVDLRRLAVSTDGVGPTELTTRGFMDYLVQKAITLGFSPVEAIRMGTLNVAEHFNLHDLIGGLAPGRFADILVIPDLKTIRPELVISNGQIVAKNGDTTLPARKHHYPEFISDCIRMDRKWAAQDFAVQIESNRSMVKVKAIDQVTKILTRELIAELPVKDGKIEMDLAHDIIKVAAIEYKYTGGKIFTGFIRGLGLHQGAVATSTAWDCSDIMVAGADETDMAKAVNRIKELKGGTVVCRNGEILAEIAFPVFSVISEEPMETLSDKLTRIQAAATDLGSKSDDIRTTLSVLATPAIPYVRICESGLFNVRLNTRMDLVIAGD